MTPYLNHTHTHIHTHTEIERKPEDVPYVGLGTISFDQSSIDVEAIFSGGRQTWQI